MNKVNDLKSLQLEEMLIHSHKFRVPMGDRGAGRRLQQQSHIHQEYRNERNTASPLLTLTHASHVATKPPGCSLKESQVKTIKLVFFTSAFRCYSLSCFDYGII